MRSLGQFFRLIRAYFIAGMACIVYERRMGKFLDDKGLSYTCSHQDEWHEYADNNRWSKKLSAIRETDWSL